MAAPVTISVQLAVRGRPLRLEMTVPSGPARLSELMPIFQGLTNVFVDAAEGEARRQGQHISCKKGCGACCRQLVPVSQSEARGLRRLVDALPEPRRSRVLARFADAHARLDGAGLLPPLRDLAGQTREQRQALGLAYFGVGVACPFLEDESCSIHPDRPLACREYLVTSPAEECAQPTAERVRCVPVPVKVSNAVQAMDKECADARAAWVPLVLALEYATAHPQEPAERPGPDWVRDVFERLAGKPVPNPAGEGPPPP